MKICLATVSLFLLLPGCSSIPTPTSEEINLRDRWAALVSPQARLKVMNEADRHTGWAEKRKIVFETTELQHVYREEQRKARWTKSATQPATLPTTLPATQP